MDPHLAVNDGEGVVHGSESNFKDTLLQTFNNKTEDNVYNSLTHDQKTEEVLEGSILRPSNYQYQPQFDTRLNSLEMPTQETSGLSDPSFVQGSPFPPADQPPPDVTDIMLPPRREIRPSQRIPKYLPDVDGQPWKVWAYPEVPTVNTEYETDTDVDPDQIRNYKKKETEYVGLIEKKYVRPEGYVNPWYNTIWWLTHLTMFLTLLFGVQGYWQLYKYKRQFEGML